MPTTATSSTVHGLIATTTGALIACKLTRDANGRLLTGLCSALNARTIEVFGLPGQIDAIFDEEGKLAGLPKNDLATEIAIRLGGQFFPGDYIAGDTVFVSTDEDGATVSLTPQQAARVVTASVD